MSVTDLIQQSTRLGLRLRHEGERLIYAPKEKASPEFLQVLRENKPALLAWLRVATGAGVNIPPPSCPLDPKEPAPTVEARETMLQFMLQRSCDRPGPLTAWLVHRESDYFDGPGRHWDCALHAYAAARDALCWNLNLPESEVLALIQSAIK